MACKAIGARTLLRRLNPTSGPYTAALALSGMRAGDSWDIRFRFGLISDGGADCTAELYFEQNHNGAGWVDMSVASGSPQVSIALPDTDYDKAFKPAQLGNYQYRVRVEYADGTYYSPVGTAVVTAAGYTVDAEVPGATVTVGVPASNVVVEVPTTTRTAAVPVTAPTAEVPASVVTVGVPRGA